MKRRSPQAVTLIELLIVVAILAILSAASLAMITAPLKEVAFADIEMQQENAVATLLRVAAADLHAAGDAWTGERPGAFACAAPDGRAVVYAVDDKAVLRRLPTTRQRADAILAGTEQPTPAPAIMTGVASFEAGPGAAEGSWRIRVRAAEIRLGRELAVERSFEFLLDPAWKGDSR